MKDIDKWTILPDKAGKKKDSLFRFRQHNVLYLDDHRIFRDGVKKACLDKYFPNAVLKDFEDGNEVLVYLTRQIQLNKSIDLIITDINHPGLKGDILVEMIRHLEKAYKRKHKIPIIIITMMDSADYLKRLTDSPDPLVSYYLTKASSIDLIVHCFEEVLL